MSAQTEELERQSKTLGEWASLKAGPGGKFLCTELRNLKRRVQEQYRDVPAAKPESAILLMGLQEREKQLASLIDLLEKSEKEKLLLDNEIKKLQHAEQGEVEPLSRRQSIIPGELNE